MKQEARRVPHAASINDLTHQAAQCLGHVIARGQIRHIVCRQGHYRIGAEACLEVAQDRFVHLIEPLVLKNQSASSVKKSGRIAQATQTCAVYRARGEGVNLDFRSEVA